MKPFTALSQPNNLIGVGLRHPHYDVALSDDTHNQHIDFIEIHAENFFAQGGLSQDLLVDVAQRYQVSVHGTSLGLGSNMAVPSDVLLQFANVVETTNAFLVSEHLCFNRAIINDKVLHSGDLLPLAYNQASLNVICRNIQQVQDKLKRPILIENLSAYVSASEVDTQVKDDMSEIDFLIAMTRQSGCGLLLDLNNLIVNALNQKVADPMGHIFNNIKALPSNKIGEIHLAGFSPQGVNGYIVDDHANAVSEQCWQLYQMVNDYFGHIPTLVEWDNALPSWDILTGEAQKAKTIMQGKA